MSQIFPLKVPDNFTNYLALPSMCSARVSLTWEAGRWTDALTGPRKHFVLTAA